MIKAFPAAKSRYAAQTPASFRGWRPIPGVRIRIPSFIYSDTFFSEISFA